MYIFLCIMDVESAKCVHVQRKLWHTFSNSWTWKAWSKLMKSQIGQLTLYKSLCMFSNSIHVPPIYLYVYLHVHVHVHWPSYIVYMSCLGWASDPARCLYWCSPRVPPPVCRCAGGSTLHAAGQGRTGLLESTKGKILTSHRQVKVRDFSRNSKRLAHVHVATLLLCIA